MGAATRLQLLPCLVVSRLNSSGTAAKVSVLPHARKLERRPPWCLEGQKRKWPRSNVWPSKLKLPLCVPHHTRMTSFGANMYRRRRRRSGSRWLLSDQRQHAKGSRLASLGGTAPRRLRPMRSEGACLPVCDWPVQPTIWSRTDLQIPGVLELPLSLALCIL